MSVIRLNNVIPLNNIIPLTNVIKLGAPPGDPESVPQPDSYDLTPQPRRSPRPNWQMRLHSRTTTIRHPRLPTASASRFTGANVGLKAERPPPRATANN